MLVGVSTHSHPKVADSVLAIMAARDLVSTHSHPKVAEAVISSILLTF